MPLSCHSAVQQIKEKTNLTVALAGNPNVGKSSIFNQLTGLGVVTANYPGKTVEINLGTTHFQDKTIGIIDLPGTYALGAVSEDQWVARRGVLENQPDVVIVIVDATNLARNLYMVLQFLDLEIPVVIALNLVDQAERKGITVDPTHLSDLLGVPVIPTVAVKGEGLENLMAAAVDFAAQQRQSRPVKLYGEDVSGPIEKLGHLISERLKDRPYGLSSRALALLLLENDEEFVTLVRREPDGDDVLRKALEFSAEIERKHGEAGSLRIARERHGLAGIIAAEVQQKVAAPPQFSATLWRWSIAPLSGIPFLTAVLAALFAFLFFVGGTLSTVFSNFWTAFVSPPLDAVIFAIFGQNVVGRTLVWGFDAGIAAALAVGIPYVLTFYFLLALLEDSGYLNSVAFLSDSLMHRFGLHGRAIIPIVAGAGCNVPAIIGTRVLTTMRERVIASTLIVLVPCSARTAVILGAVSIFIGWQAALAIFGLVVVLIGLVGLGLNLVMPGQSSGLVMEMFPFRTPNLVTIAKKTWYRFKDFVFVAFPIVVVGSLVLGSLYESNLLWNLAGPLSPVVEGWLGLPAVAGLTLLFAVLRKELALQLLVTLAIVQFGSGAQNLLQFMSPHQIFVYVLVNTIYIPCVATMAVLFRELGRWRATGVIAFTVTLALIIGGIANYALTVFKVF